MQLNDIFRIENYAEAIQFVRNNSNFTIKELEVDSEGRRFQIVEIPPLTQQQVLSHLRAKREIECFSIINRGELWYSKLTEIQKQELNTWYQSWLDVTEETNKDENGNYIIPIKPSWLI